VARAKSGRNLGSPGATRWGSINWPERPFYGRSDKLVPEVSAPACMKRRCRPVHWLLLVACSLAWIAIPVYRASAPNSEEVLVVDPRRGPLSACDSR
jgi:hypothetical protein